MRGNQLLTSLGWVLLVWFFLAPETIAIVINALHLHLWHLNTPFPPALTSTILLGAGPLGLILTERPDLLRPGDDRKI